MTRPARIALLTALMAWAAPALADDALTISGDDVGPVGIDACSDQIAGAFQLSATVNYDAVETRTPTFRIYYYTGSDDAVCDRETGLDSCPQHLERDDGTLCGCVYETGGGATSFNTTTTLADVFGDQASVLCAEGAPTSVRFFSETYYTVEGDLSAQAFKSDLGASIEIDRTRPSSPTDIPRVQEAENALIINADGIAETGVTYEVCVRLLGTVGTPVGENTNNETLREGFTQCRSAGSAVSEYRFESLENDVNYEVVYAAIDDAGNRGGNSPSGSGAPQPQLDFAEQYTASLGGQAGETGGCSAAPDRSSTSPAWFALALLALIRRRRS